MADTENNINVSKQCESEYLSSRTDKLREIARSIEEYNYEDEWLL